MLRKKKIYSMEEKNGVSVCVSVCVYSEILLRVAREGLPDKVTFE